MDAVLRQYVNGQRIDEHLSMETYTSGSITSTHYYHENALGNIVALTDSTGAVVERYTYQAYGAPEFRDSLSAPLSLFSSPAGNPFLFNGQRYDPESGLSYYRHRYLNHTQGRFVNRDPAGIDGLGGVFSNVANNPITNKDPYGLQKIGEPTLTPIKIGELAKSSQELQNVLSAIGKKLEDVSEQTLVHGCKDGSCGYVFGWRFKCDKCESSIIQYVKREFTYYGTDGKERIPKDSAIRGREFVEGFQLKDGESVGLDAHWHAKHLPFSFASDTGEVLATKLCMKTTLISCCGTYDGETVTDKYKKWDNGTKDKIKCSGPQKTVVIKYCHDRDNKEEGPTIEGYKAE